MSSPRPTVPDTAHRWRCAGCGNLTRFDVTRTRRTQEFWHFDLAGDHQVEQVDVLGESVETVKCRWCGRTDAVELVQRSAWPDEATADPAGPTA